MPKIKLTKDQRKVLYYCFRCFTPQPLPRQRNICLSWWASRCQEQLPRRTFWSAEMRQQVEQCLARRLDLTSAWYRFCRQDWWCPFCYARRIIVPCIDPLWRFWVSADAPLVLTTSVVLAQRWGDTVTPEKGVLNLPPAPSQVKLNRFSRFFAGMRLVLPAWDVHTGCWRWQERSIWVYPSAKYPPNWLAGKATRSCWRSWSAMVWQQLSATQRWRILCRGFLAYPLCWLEQPDGGWWLGPPAFRWRARASYGLVRR